AAASRPLSFTDTATTKPHTLSLHDALPIYRPHSCHLAWKARRGERDAPDRCRGATVRRGPRDLQEHLPGLPSGGRPRSGPARLRSEEHTSELQSLTNLVCRLLLEKKKERTP